MNNRPLIVAFVAAVTPIIAAAIRPVVGTDKHWHSGYISPDGVFSGCWLCGHTDLALKIARDLGWPDVDPKLMLERSGWITVTADGFYWDRRPTADQREAIVLYCIERGLAETRFNDPRHAKALWRAQQDGTF